MKSKIERKIIKNKKKIVNLRTLIGCAESERKLNDVDNYFLLFTFLYFYFRLDEKILNMRKCQQHSIIKEEGKSKKLITIKKITKK